MHMHSGLMGTMCMATILSATAANALEWKQDRFALKLTGYATGGIIETDDVEQAPELMGDWRVRAQGNYAIAAGQTLGLVFSIDADTIDQDDFKEDAFIFWEDRQYGRIEFGFTDSIARKLGVGLPDVGGLRMNHKPLFYKLIHTHGPVIADTITTTGYDALRVNIASVPRSGAQYGLSVAGITDDYKFAVDAGLKLRNPAGKLKTAWSFGASFMDAPKHYRTESYTPYVNADWRAQASAGMNLQYNSWIWGTSVRAIYDYDPTGTVSDGVSLGTGVSYDLLKYSVSISYVLSDTGIWHHDTDNFIDHSAIASFRYKYSENVDGWISGGITSKTPFLSVGMRATF